MLLTLTLSVIMMIGLFLMVFSAVALIQDKKLFTSAPPDIQEVIKPRKERFPHAHLIGWIILIIAILLFPVSIIIGAWNGIIQRYTFWQFFLRFFVMFCLVKLFDIFFLDWFLLCHSRFYQHYYPETDGCVGFNSFGFNKRTHLVHVLLFIPLSLVIAGICMFF